MGMRIGNRNFFEHGIQLIQEFATTYRTVSRKELAYMICENLNWKNEAGNLKVDFCLVLFQKRIHKIQLPYPTLFFFELGYGFSVFSANYIDLTYCFLFCFIITF